MARCILFLVLLLWSPAGLAGQVAPARPAAGATDLAQLSRVVLDSGQVVVGRVLSMDAETLHLETAQGRAQQLQLAHVLRIERATRADGSASARRIESQPVGRGIDQHLESFLHRYAWIVPTDARNRATLGALMFVALAGLIRLAARMIELPHRDFGRCCVMALLMFGLMTVHTTFPVLETSQWLAATVTLDFLVWFVGTRLIFGSGAYEGIVLMVFCLFATVVGVLLAEVAGWVLEVGH